jgi:hypothetical protein
MEAYERICMDCMRFDPHLLHGIVLYCMYCIVCIVLQNPTQIIARCDEPILSPELAWEVLLISFSLALSLSLSLSLNAQLNS